MIKNWLKIYWRNLSKNKVYFVLTLLGLALGIWGVLLSYLYYKEEVQYDQWNPYKDEVFLVNTNLNDGGIWTAAPYAIGPRLKDLGVEDYMYLPYYHADYVAVDGEKRFFTKGLQIQSNFFEFFPFEMIQGDKTIQDPTSIFVLDTYAQALIGPDPIGKRVRYQGEWFVVKGVYSITGNPSSIAPTILFSGMEKEVKANSDNWGDYVSTLYIKPTHPNKLDRLAKEMKQLLYDHVYVRLAKEKGQTTAAYLEESGDFMKSYDFFSLSEQHTLTNADANGTLEASVNMPRFYILVGLALAILLLAVVNYVNLLLVQTLKRHREFAVRLIAGSSYVKIFGQLLFECLLTLVTASILSCVLVELSLPSIRVFLDSRVPFSLLDHWAYFLLFLIGIALLASGISYGVIRRFTLFRLLKGQLSHGSSSFGIRQGMMIFQFVIASFFILGTGVVYQQVHYMLDKELGLSKEEILILPFVPTNSAVNTFQLYETYKKELQGIPGVQQVGGAAFRLAEGGYNSTSLSYQGVSIQVANVAMDVEYLDLLRIKIAAGRGFVKELASDTISNVLVNKKFEEKVGDEHLLDKQVIWNGMPFTVVGIVDNYHAKGLTQDYLPMVYFRSETIPWLFEQVQELYVRFDPTKIDQVLAESEKVYGQLKFSVYPFSYEFLSQRFDKKMKKNIQERDSLLTLSIIVVFIALFGLYSLVSFYLANQYKEIAIHKVLGASNTVQMQHLAKQYVLQVVLGFGLAIYPSYYFMNTWLSAYAFRIEISWVNFVVAFLFLLLVTVLIVWFKVRQAVQLNVLQHIKYD